MAANKNKKENKNTKIKAKEKKRGRKKGGRGKKPPSDFVVARYFRRIFLSVVLASTNLS